MPDDQPHRTAREPGIGHEANDNAPLSAQRGNARCGIEHFRHSRGPAGPLVTHDDHVVVLEAVRLAVQRIQQTLFSLKYPRRTAKNVAFQPTFDTGQL